MLRRLECEDSDNSNNSPRDSGSAVLSMRDGLFVGVNGSKAMRELFILRFWEVRRWMPNPSAATISTRITTATVSTEFTFLFAAFGFAVVASDSLGERVPTFGVDAAYKGTVPPAPGMESSSLICSVAVDAGSVASLVSGRLSLAVGVEVGCAGFKVEWVLPIGLPVAFVAGGAGTAGVAVMVSAVSAVAEVAEGSVSVVAVVRVRVALVPVVVVVAVPVVVVIDVRVTVVAVAVAALVMLTVVVVKVVVVVVVSVAVVLVVLVMLLAVAVSDAASLVASAVVATVAVDTIVVASASIISGTEDVVEPLVAVPHVSHIILHLLTASAPTDPGAEQIAIPKTAHSGKSGIPSQVASVVTGVVVVVVWGQVPHKTGQLVL